MRTAISMSVAIALVSAAPVLAAGPKCQDIPLRVTLYHFVTDPTTGNPIPSAIVSDGGGEYVNGVSASATIKICSGTNDAVLNLSGSGSRTFTLVFPDPLNGSIVEGSPSWVPGAWAMTGWINVRNITHSTQPFATHVGSTFTRVGDRSTYRLGFRGESPDLPSAPNLHDPSRTPADNTPFPSSPVVVYPTYPPVCGTGNMPSWLVRGTSPNYPNTTLQVGTLHKQPSNPRGVEVHQGQYTLPFEVRIEALKCFNY